MGKALLDSATKKRLITHMNTDHKDTMALYLQVYCQLSRKEASQSPKLEDLTASELIIRTFPYGSSPSRYLVPIEPPLASSQDARQRFADMHAHCLEKLGLSNIIVTEYRPPKGVAVFMFFVLLGALIGFSRRSFFQPGSEVYEAFGLEHVPRVAQFCYRAQPIIWFSLVGIHAVETVYLAWWRLRPHRVPFFSLVALQWLFSTFVEGAIAQRRFDDMVREKGEKKEHIAPTFDEEKKKSKK
jgi:hypothetical protein